jgi:hypothetical protein
VLPDFVGISANLNEEVYMQCAVVLAEGIKQVMLTPETDNEKMALKMFSPTSKVSVAIKHGTFHEPRGATVAGYYVEECRGGYLRAWRGEESVMLVIRDEKE